MIDKSILIAISCLIISGIFIVLLPKGELKANLIFFGVIVGVLLLSCWLIIYGIRGVYDYLINR